MAKGRIAGAIKAAAHSTEPAAERTTGETETPPRPFKARTREGKKMIAAPVDPAARQQLKVFLQPSLTGRPKI